MWGPGVLYYIMRNFNTHTVYIKENERKKNMNGTKMKGTCKKTKSKKAPESETLGKMLRNNKPFGPSGSHFFPCVFLYVGAGCIYIYRYIDI